MTWLRSLSIRARIALGSVLVATLVVSGAAFAVHLQLAQFVRDAEVTLATGDLAPYVADISSNPDEAPDAPSAGVLVYIRAPDGSVPVDTMPHDVRAAIEGRGKGPDSPADDASRGADGSGNQPTRLAAEGVSTMVTDEDVRFTLVAETVTSGEGRWQLVSARSGAGSDLTVEALDQALVIGAGFLVVVFGFTAWALTTAALRPVSRMRRIARTLSTESSETLLPVGPARDELADLAETLNAFIIGMRDTAAREREMVSAASHELRTPIAALTTQLELAHRSFGDAPALEHEIRAAQGSLERLARLAANLLELSRLDALRGQSSNEAEQAADLVELESEMMSAVDRARLIAGTRGPDIEFTIDLEDSTDRTRLSAPAFSRILDNLLANAIAATRGTDAGRIHLELRQQDGAVELTVSDTGKGLPESFIPHAFERFTRPDEARDTSSGGSGLGLALVEALARNAGGVAAIVNLAQGGARVTVTLPSSPRGANM
ncbi:sensor histidine kinase [Pseudoclavibacter helvolus]|uniref:histidine kinase n=1 Tax=Pseudoclavibacter helvolus TaxID=255205 RepID=A0A7W4YGQ6_9MICO|nr:HAMP domain-containing sensor histidine kinase [Pseudoclavibacter helvolus]MBB2959552.1 signal transduction histidine kinase [Pseudoclavibacter helvolus]